MTHIVNSLGSKKPTVKNKNINLRFVNIGIFSILSVLGVFYLISVSDLTVRGFALQELKSQAMAINSDKLANEEKVNKLQSYYSLSARTKGLNMVAIGDIEYLNSNSPTLAKK